MLIVTVHHSYPFEDPCVVLSVTGQAIRDALENAVSLYPALEGRFPQVSNISVDFNASLPPNRRLVTICIGGEALNPTASYRLATRDYMARGKDGFASLLATSAGGTAEEIVPADDGLRIYELVLRFFTMPEEFADIFTVNFDSYSEMEVSGSWSNNSAASASSSSNLSSLSTLTACSPSITPSSSPRSVFSSESSEVSEALSSTPVTPTNDGFEELKGFECSSEEDFKDEWLNMPWIMPKVEGRIRIINKVS